MARVLTIAKLLIKRSLIVGSLMMDWLMVDWLIVDWLIRRPIRAAESPPLSTTLAQTLRCRISHSVSLR
ncbi:MAG: hypothetical protein ACOH2H_00380 [Cypionkella sp.]